MIGKGRIFPLLSAVHDRAMRSGVERQLWF